MALLKLRALLVCCIAWMLLCTGSALAQAVPIKIVVFGDSISAGYQLGSSTAFPAMLERKLQSAGYYVQVINMSVPGATTGDAVKRVEEIWRMNPDIVLVQLGINDAMRGLDVNKVIFRNLNVIVGSLVKKKIGVLVCGIKGPSNMKKSYNKMFESIFYASASTYSTSYYHDMLKGVTGRADLTLADGLHPNEKGTLAIVQNIYPTVLSLVKWRKKLLEYQANTE